MSNVRFRELSLGVVVELIATRIQFDYVPNGLAAPEALTATWMAQEFLPMGDGYQSIGNRSERLTTILAEHANKVLSVYDPITGQTVELSAIGAVTWLKTWFDYQWNRDAAPPVPEEPTEEGPIV